MRRSPHLQAWTGSMLLECSGGRTQFCNPCLGESTGRCQACLQQSALLNSIVPAGNRNTMACVDNQECAVATALALPSVLFPFCSSCPRFSCLQQPKLFAVDFLSHLSLSARLRKCQREPWYDNLAGGCVVGRQRPKEAGKFMQAGAAWHARLDSCHQATCVN